MPEYELKPIDPAVLQVGDVVRCQVVQFGTVANIQALPANPATGWPAVYVITNVPLDTEVAPLFPSVVIPADPGPYGITLQVRRETPSVNAAFLRQADGSGWVFTDRGYLCTKAGSVYLFGSLYPLSAIAPLVAA